MINDYFENSMPRVIIPKIKCVFRAKTFGEETANSDCGIEVLSTPTILTRNCAYTLHRIINLLTRMETTIFLS